MKKHNTLFFDLDGTLVDTLNDISSTMNDVLSANYLPTRGIADYNRWIGGGTKKMVIQAAPKSSNIEDLHSQFIHLYEENLCQNTVAYQGIHSLLHSLSCQSFNICVLSNKAHNMALTLCREIFPSIPFKAIHGMTKLELAKPNPYTLLSIAKILHVHRSDCLMIGDTGIDIETGKKAGCATMAVSWGYETTEKLQTHNPDYFVTHPSEIDDYIGNYSRRSTL